MIPLTEQQKKLLAWVGYPLLALVVFVFAVFYTFPYERLKDKIEEVVSVRYDITISSIRPTILPGGIVLESVTLQGRPEDPDQVPSMMFFDEIEVDVGLFALLFGRVDVDLAAETASGSLEGYVSADSLNLKKAESFEVAVTAENLQIGGLPGVREGVGLPLKGGLNADMRLALPKMKFKDAEGHLKFSCGGCTIGDGVSKVKPRLPESKKNNPRYKRRLAMYGDGLTVPELQLGAAEGSITIKKGVGKIDKLQAISPDGELAITGEIRFADPFKNSTLPGCVRFKLTDELKKREKDFGNIDLMLDAKRDDEGFFSFPTVGKLMNLQWKTRKKCKEGGAGPERKKSRPRINTNRLAGKKARDRAAGKTEAAEPRARATPATPAGRKKDAGTADDPTKRDDVGVRGARDDEDEDEEEGDDEEEDGDEDTEEGADGDERDGDEPID